MSILEFQSIKNLLGGAKPSAEEQKSLYKEAMLMTLARACSSDTNIEAVEIDAVQAILKKETGQDISAADIRVASNSTLFHAQPLDKYLIKVGPKLSTTQRLKIAKRLASVLKSDIRVTAFEAKFFNMVAKALKVTPAELVGLVPKD